MSSDPQRPVRVLSCGGGLDSFAMLLRSIELAEPPDVVVFCDVSDPQHTDPGEWPGTYRHLREVVEPLCRDLGIEFVWLSTDEYPVRDARSLFSWMQERGQIPVGGPSRICTTIAKVERYERWMQHRFPGRDVETWIGFEANETSRAANDPYSKGDRKCKPGQARRINRFPLIEWGLCRCRCEQLVRDAGYIVPRKSACVFCPYGSRIDWRTFKRELPEQFEQVAEMERAKPPTKRGFKLSIMGYRRIKDTGPGETPVRGVHYKAPGVHEFVENPGRTPKPKPCPVCGAPERATKATACGYLDEEAA